MNILSAVRTAVSRHGHFFYCILISFIAALTVSGMDYYVAPSGLDTNSGTIGAPFKTIAKARDVVKTVNGSMTADINVYLRGGWHTLSAPLTFDQSCSGTNGYNVIYQAYPGEYPVISGGRQITGWTLHDTGKNIWKAGAPGLETRQLYVDCVRAVRAHKGSGLSGVVRTNTGFTTTDAGLQNWGNKSDIEFIFNGLQGGIMRSYGVLWIEARIGVASISGTVITMKEPAWSTVNIVQNSVLVQWTPFPTDIENAYELLDQPGEWYLDRSQDVVYYIPRAGENMSQVKVIAPVLETLVSGTGVLGTPIHNIQFKGITFAHATWLRPNTNDGFAETQSNVYHVPGIYLGYPDGNVVFKTAHNIRFERCIFKHLGREGLSLSDGSQNCVVTGCVFTDISANCIRVGTVYPGDPLRPDTRERDTGNQITNCYIHDAPCEYHGGCGIAAGYVSDILLSHNEIGKVPYSGISCGWGWGADSYAQNNQFTYNYIHHFCQSMGDGGAIYTLSPQSNTAWNNNWFDNMPSRPNGGAIYPDEASAYMEIHHNVCSNIGNLWLHIWTSSIHDINTHDIWTNTGNALNNGTNCPVTNVTIISGSLSNWPAGAQAIANNAGIQAADRDIKTLPCACSMNQDTSVVSIPSISPNGGTFSDSVTVTLSCATSGATIRYTTNGSDPTSTSTLYAAPFKLTATTTVKARGFKTGLTESGMVSATFTISTPLLLGHWSLDGNAGDASTNANNGTLVGNPAYVAGMSGQALSFNPTDGSDDAVSISGLAAYKSPLVAVAAWVKLTTTDTQGGEVISLGDSYALRVLPDGNTAFFFYDGSTWVMLMTTGVNVMDGAWHHLVGQKTNAGLEIYVDGILKNSYNTTASIAYSLGTDLFIGRHGNGDTNFDFNGAIDEVRLYNYALSAAEVTALYTGTTGLVDQRPAPSLQPGLLITITPSPASGRCDIIVDRQDLAAIKGMGIYTLDNRLVRRIPVSQSYSWDTRDSFGRLVPNGVYAVRLDTGAGGNVSAIVIVR